MPDGRTLIFGTVADPVAHVTSPERFGWLFEQWGFNGAMMAFHVRPENLKRFLHGVRHLSNLAGFCVTIPHKQAIVPLLDEVTDRAALVGAVNVVRRLPDGRLVGDQMDGMGFVEGLRKAGHEISGKDVFMAGAGGAAAGIAFAIAAAGARKLTIHNRTAATAAALARRVATQNAACRVEVGGKDPAGHAIAINATSAGMRETDELPMSLDSVGPGMVVAEVIMRPRETALLAGAARRGATVHHGDEMLLAQLPMLARFMGAHPKEEGAPTPEAPGGTALPPGPSAGGRARAAAVAWATTNFCD